MRTSRFRVPISSAAHLTQLCVDIAVYRLALSQDVATAEHRTRYEDALSVLTKIADGRVSLSLAPPAPGEEGDPEITGPQPIVAGGPPRLFSRDQMRDL
ncbi:phage protein Gp36 family protein [Paracoccus sp. (in: a-proteobacteria)]|uniref:phage protein Gp36 family protein n=1 Tax=Paracoccus sp. TaxID=267 RepID=UPI002AFF2C82|nr:phage protein Gp36 family protein [Paracoccus sp. (in: a-proteobacteria)]